MAPSPLTRQQLLGLPWASIVLGVAGGAFFWPLLGRTGTVVLCAALAALLFGLGLWIVARSDFAVRHGRLGALYLLAFLTPLAAGTCVMTLHLGGAPGLAAGAAATVVATMLATTALAAWRQSRRLAAQGPDGPWWREHVDRVAARIRADALTGTRPAAGTWTPVLVAGLAANGPWLWRAAGTSDAQAMPVVLTLLLGAALWVCAVNIGPMLARAGALAAAERASGRPFRHEGWEDLQALRRSAALTRWLMVDAR